jgi:hypothetical protein
VLVRAGVRRERVGRERQGGELRDAVVDLQGDAAWARARGVAGGGGAERGGALPRLGEWRGDGVRRLPRLGDCARTRAEVALYWSRWAAGW